PVRFRMPGADLPASERACVTISAWLLRDRSDLLARVGCGPCFVLVAACMPPGLGMAAGDLRLRSLPLRAISPCCCCLPPAACRSFLLRVSEPEAEICWAWQSF